MRCFVAAQSDPNTSDVLEDCRRYITSMDPSWSDDKWVPRENLHLTLAFLGDVAESDVESMAKRIGDVVPSHSAFNLPFVGISGSPSPRQARLIWAEFSDAISECESLAQSLSLAASPFTDTRNDRPFRAHITLCRVRRPHAVSADSLCAASDLARARMGAMSVSCVTLIQSRLTTTGPIYTEIGMWPLGGQ